MDFDYKKKGYCKFKLGDKLNEQTKDVCTGFGVYIMRSNTENGEILYIGKSGTFHNGTKSYKSEQNLIHKKEPQNLRGRLNNKQEGVSRETFLSNKLLSSTFLHTIVIEWYIVDERKILPGFLEAALLQEYYEKHKCLPLWNTVY